jgi:hypothetical protein
MRSSLLGLLVLLLLVACESTPREPLPEPVLDADLAVDFDRARPVRVVVGAVAADAAPGAPAEAVRAAFYRGLLERRYAPLKLDVDPATLPPDEHLGRLSLRLDVWDRSRIETQGAVLASGEAILVRRGQTVWRAAFQNLALRCTDPEVRLTAEQQDERAAHLLGRRVLATLPVKGD